MKPKTIVTRSLCSLWLARVITRGLVFRHSVGNCSRVVFNSNGVNMVKPIYSTIPFWPITKDIGNQHSKQIHVVRAKRGNTCTSEAWLVLWFHFWLVKKVARFCITNRWASNAKPKQVTITFYTQVKTFQLWSPSCNYLLFVRTGL